MYSMKISFKLIIVALAFLFIILISMGSAPKFAPYAFPTSSLHQYPYEGFHTEYSTYPENQVIDSMNSKIISPPEMGTVTKVSGFDGLLVSPNAPETPVDIYSQAIGDPSVKSYGLTNSRGYLSLTPEQIKLLTTRGENASGGSTIG